MLDGVTHRTSFPYLILFSSTLCLLYITAHQYLVILRHLAFLQLFAVTLHDLLLTFKSKGGLKIKFDYTLLIEGIAYGAEHTLFQWSLLKLPPACGFALHVAAMPLSRIIMSYTKRTFSPRDPLVLFVLGLVVDRVVPMNPSALLQGVVALMLRVGAQSFKPEQNNSVSDSQSSPLDTSITRSLSAMSVSLLLDLAFGPNVFGETFWGIKQPLLWILLVVAVALFYVLHQSRRNGVLVPPEHSEAVFIAALSVSAAVPGMRERIAWFDIFAMLAAAFLLLWDAQRMERGLFDGTGEAKDLSGA